jgi:hypothetical protein
MRHRADVQGDGRARGDRRTGCAPSTLSHGRSFGARRARRSRGRGGIAGWSNSDRTNRCSNRGSRRSQQLLPLRPHRRRRPHHHHRSALGVKLRGQTRGRGSVHRVGHHEPTLEEPRGTTIRRGADSADIRRRYERSLRGHRRDTHQLTSRKSNQLTRMSSAKAAGSRPRSEGVAGGVEEIARLQSVWEWTATTIRARSRATSCGCAYTK